MFFLAAFTLLMLIVGCGNSSKAISPGNHKVVLQLNWVPDPTFTGEYLAKRSYWRDRGLDVEILSGSSQIDPIAAVVSKKADFAVVGADKAVIAHTNGADIRVVAVDFQRNPVGWIVRTKHNIHCFRDMVGRRDLTLGDKVGTETTAILKVCLKRSGIANKLTSTGVGFDLPFFMDRPDLVYPVYLNEEPIRVAKQHIQVTEIDPADQKNGRVRMYGNVIVARTTFVNENPKVAEAMVSGLRAGWERARDDEQGALAMIKDEMKDYDRESLEDVMKRSTDFATDYYGTKVEPCHMEVEAWKNTIRTLVEGGVIKKEFEPQELVWFGEN